MNKWIKAIVRYALLMSGFFIIANGFVLIVQAQLGADPWNVFQLGITLNTGISLGLAIQSVGAVLIAVSFLLGVKPHVGTILNAIFIGLFVDLTGRLGYIPQPHRLWLKILFLAAGIFLVGLGSALYMSGNRGAGPRDSLMLALIKISGWRLGFIRGIMEVTVTLLGLILRGPAGIGTVIYALSVGFCIEVGFIPIRWLKKSDLYRIYWQEHPKITASGPDCLKT